MYLVDKYLKDHIVSLSHNKLRNIKGNILTEHKSEKIIEESFSQTGKVNNIFLKKSTSYTIYVEAKNLFKILQESIVAAGYVKERY